jgi:hypothetical protein
MSANDRTTCSCHAPRGPKRALASVLTLAFMVAHAWAAVAATITARLERTTIALGESVGLTIVVEGATAENVRVPSAPGLRIGSPGRSTRFESINGQQRIYSDFSFLVTPLREGEFTIGPFSVTVNNRDFEADPVTLKVVPRGDPAASRDDGLDRAAFLELKLPDRPVYVGETFVAEIFLYAVGGDIQQAPRLIANGFTLGEMKNDPPERNVRLNNQIYARVRFYQTLTAARPGTLTAQAADCALLIPMAQRPGNFPTIFDFGFRERRRVMISSQPREIRVLPLPRDNVPASFHGAVGDFGISSSASPTDVKTGDPITLRVEIEGIGNFDSVRLPDSPGWKGFQSYPPSANFEPDSQDPLGITGTKRFEQVVTPMIANLTEVPPIEFSFFSPRLGDYRTVQTRPIPIQVARGPDARREEHLAEAKRPEIAPLKPHLGMAMSIAPSLWSRPPVLIALLAAPWAGWGLVALWRRRLIQSGSAQAARRRRAMDRQIDADLANLRRLAAGGDSEAFFAGLFRFLQNVVAAKVGQPPASITEGALDACLPPRGVSPGTVTALHSLFQACNQARYGNVASRVDLEKLCQEAESVRHALRAP